MSGILFAVAAGLLYAISPRVALFGVVVTYLFVPFSVIDAVSPAIAPLHPSSLAALAIALCAMIRWALVEGQSLLVPPLGRSWATCLIVLLLAASLSEVVNERAGLVPAVGFFVNQWVGPSILVCLILVEIHYHRCRPIDCVYLLIGVASLQSILAIAVTLGLISQPFRSEFSKIGWWHLVGQRALGATDHPLNLMLLLGVALPCVFYLRIVLLRISVFVLLVAGIGLTQSRIGLGIIIGTVAYSVIYFFLRGRPAQSVVIGIVGIAAAFAAPFVFRGTFERVEDDAGSTDARREAWSYVFRRIDEFVVFGKGLFNAKPMLLDAGLDSSAESAFLSFALAFGLVFALCFFCLVIVPWVRSVANWREITPACFSCVVAFVSVQFYSSLATESTATLLLFYSLLLSIVCAGSFRASGSYDSRTLGIVALSTRN